jgi:hypothetical protein
MPIQPDYSDLLRALSSSGVEYLVIGGHAVAFHTEPRATKDFDVWVKPTLENARRVHAALKRFGAPLRVVTVEDFARPGIVYQVGIEPVRIDVLTSAAGLDFDAAYASRVAASYGGVPIFLLSLEDLLTNKLATGRPQDLIDAEVLRKQLERRAAAGPA